jgi:hypothetical protein
MEILFIIIPLGVLFSLSIFFIFERRAIKANINSEKEAKNMSEKLENYDTVNNAALFGVASYFLTLILSISTYDHSYGLIHALLYIFGTTFIGSIVIFIIKIKKNILIKVFASFLYGVPHLMASSTAFLTSFILS